VTVAERPTLQRVGSVSDFELDAFKLFEIAGRSVGVIRTSRGFFAVRNRCPHQGAPICGGWIGGVMLPSPPHEYHYSDERLMVMCPWHHWEFDLDTGASVEHVAKHRLVTYDVVVEHGDVYVDARAKRAAKEAR
jgi:3-phenylpropionate/trans-cinnamate dioxygenase ferredoxin subunit